MNNELYIRTTRAAAYLRRKAEERENRAINRLVNTILLGLFIILCLMLAAEAMSLL